MKLIIFTEKWSILSNIRWLPENRIFWGYTRIHIYCNFWDSELELPFQWRLPKPTLTVFDFMYLIIGILLLAYNTNIIPFWEIKHIALYWHETLPGFVSPYSAVIKNLFSKVKLHVSKCEFVTYYLLINIFIIGFLLCQVETTFPSQGCLEDWISKNSKIMQSRACHVVST